MVQPTWRAMTEPDLFGVKALSDVIHPGLVERMEVFADRLAVFPAGCQVLADEADILGYAVSHPARLMSPPPLDALLGRLPDDADSFYIHDVAVAPALRGTGHARIGVYHVLDVGDAYRHVALVSVYGTADFWKRFGFVDRTRDLEPSKLAAYGPDACYMVRRKSAVEFAPRAG